MCPPLLWKSRFWDALLVLLWLALTVVLTLFGVAVKVAPHYVLSPILTPLLSAGFVAVSAARFLALRIKHWPLALVLGQAGASLIMLWLGAIRPAHTHWVPNVVEHVLAGSAGAMIIYAFVYFLGRMRRFREESSVIQELMRKRMLQ